MQYSDEIERMVSELAGSCRELVDLAEGDLLLHVQARDGLIFASLYHDQGDEIVFVEPDNELFDRIEEFWSYPPPEERWRLASLVIRGMRCEITFEYGGEIDHGTSGDTQPRHLAARALLGDKPIVYPGLDENSPESIEMWTEDDPNTLG